MKQIIINNPDDALVKHLMDNNISFTVNNIVDVVDESDDLFVQKQEESAKIEALKPHRTPRQEGAPVLTVNVDGSCKGQTYGGMGIVMVSGMNKKTYSIPSTESPTTNIRMEMMAVVEALNRITKFVGHIRMISDNETVVVKGYNNWLDGWIDNAWVSKATNKDVANVDLWREIVKAVRAVEERGCTFSIEWVPREQNHEADTLAQSASDQLKISAAQAA